MFWTPKANVASQCCCLGSNPAKPPVTPSLCLTKWSNNCKTALWGCTNHHIASNEHSWDALSFAFVLPCSTCAVVHNWHTSALDCSEGQRHTEATHQHSLLRRSAAYGRSKTCGKSNDEMRCANAEIACRGACPRIYSPFMRQLHVYTLTPLSDNDVDLTQARCLRKCNLHAQCPKPFFPSSTCSRFWSQRLYTDYAACTLSCAAQCHTICHRALQNTINWS